MQASVQSDGLINLRGGVLSKKPKLAHHLMGATDTYVFMLLQRNLNGWLDRSSFEIVTINWHSKAVSSPCPGFLWLQLFHNMLF